MSDTTVLRDEVHRELASRINDTIDDFIRETPATFAEILHAMQMTTGCLWAQKADEIISGARKKQK